jgi:hypothetical protein
VCDQLSSLPASPRLTARRKAIREVTGPAKIANAFTFLSSHDRRSTPAPVGIVLCVASIDEVASLAMQLPEVTEGERHGNLTWAVRGKAFAWERPFSKADIKRFGEETPPAGPILAVRVADLAEKEAVLSASPRGFFTIPHFDGYSAVLIQLDSATESALREAIVDAWLACAPPPLAQEYLSTGDPS